MDEEITHAPTVDENQRSIESESKKLPQYFVTFVANLAAFAGGTLIGWHGNLFFEFDELSEEWSAELMLIGIIIGALHAGKMADIEGRKVTIMIMSVPLMVSWIMIYFAWQYQFVHLFVGLGLGGICTVLPMYVSEIAEEKIKGSLGSVFPIMLALGIEYCNLVNYFFHYSTIAMNCGALNVVFLLAFFKLPESPLFLFMKRQRQDVENSLRYLRGERYNIHEEINILEKEMSQKSIEPFYKSVCKRSNLKAMVICLGLMLFYHSSRYRFFKYLARRYFEEAGIELDYKASQILAPWMNILFAIIAASLVDRFSRKFLLYFSIISMAICLFTINFVFHYQRQELQGFDGVPLLCVTTYLLAYNLVFGTISWIIPGEILHPDIKGIGIGIVISFFWILDYIYFFWHFIFIRFLQELLESDFQSIYYAIIVLTLASLVYTIFVRQVVIETKKKNVFEIQEELKK